MFVLDYRVHFVSFGIDRTISGDVSAISGVKQSSLIALV